MPQELRKIRFSQDDIRNAAVAFCFRANIRMPAANIDRVDVTEQDDAMVQMRFTTTMPGERNTVELTSQQLFAALLLFCRREGIPIPKEAKKVLQPSDDSIELMISVNWAATKNPSQAAARSGGGFAGVAAKA